MYRVVFYSHKASILWRQRGNESLAPIQGRMGAIFVRLPILFLFSHRESKYMFIFTKEEFKWKTMKTGNVKGNPRSRHWANDYPVFWPGRRCRQSKQNQCDPKITVTVRHFALQATMLEIARYTAESQAAVNEKSGRQTEPLQITEVWLSTDSRYSKAADKSCAYQRKIFGTEKEFRNRWTENFPDENVWPPTARVSAEARDENEWDAHDVCEFSR